MAKLSLEFDTVEKKLVATIDGKKLKNVSSIEFFGGFDGDSFGMEVRSIESDEDNGIFKVTRLVAGEKDPTEEVEEEDKDLTQSIAKRLFS